MSSLLTPGHREFEEAVHRIRNSPYIPGEPTLAQWPFLLEQRKEVMFGGAAGPGKSWALLASALMYVDIPSYRALLLRRTFADLALPGALMDMAGEWLENTDAKRKDGGRKWVFPSGASLTFGYLHNENHKYRYQSSAFTFIGWDELTQFSKTQYRYMFSRVRRGKGSRTKQVAPLRIRSASNPGGVGHDWVKERFIDPDEGAFKRRLFIPANMIDNPHLDEEEYSEMLAELDPVTRAQLEHGDWEIRPAGNYFLPLVKVVAEADSPVTWRGPHITRCRAWDLAATETGDWAVGTLLARDRNTKTHAVEHIVRVRCEPDKLEQALASTARMDGPYIPQVVEQEGGSAGKMAIRDIKVRIMSESPTFSVSPTGDKLTRARLAASIVADGRMELRPGPWVTPFLDELAGFPEVNHDDQVDSLAHGCHWLAKQAGAEKAPAVPRGSQAEVQAKPRKLATSRARIVR